MDLQKSHHYQKERPMSSYLGVVGDFFGNVVFFFEGFSLLNGDEPRSVSFLFCRKLDSSASSSSESTVVLKL